MGKWGNGIFDNDLSLDVKDNYIEMLYDGKSDEEAQRYVVESLGKDFQDFEEMSNFWMSLASIEWEYGRLDNDAKMFALRCIEKELYLMQTNSDFGERYQQVIALKTNLCSVQPPKKKLMKRKRFCCPWKIGDAFAYLMESEYAKEKGFFNKYLIFHKVDETTWYPDHIIPIVRVKIAEKIPQSEQELDELEYVQTFFTRFEDRFFPINHAISIEEQIREKSIIEYKQDEFGYLPEYRISICSTSKKDIPEKLIYLGNYKSISPPKNEFIPHAKISICSRKWGDLENSLIEKYLLYNKRKSIAYGGKGL